jgi:ribosomal protein S27AE
MQRFRCGNCGVSFKAPPEDPICHVQLIILQSRALGPAEVKSSTWFCPNCTRVAAPTLKRIGTINPPFIGLQ